MQRAVLLEKRRLEIQDVPLPQCGPGDVLVEVKYAAVCRTDRKAYHIGQRDLSLPRVLGHEIAGVVLEAGERVSQYAKGDNVQVHPGLFCGACDSCRNGQDQICSDMEILGFHRDGGFQEVCLVPEKGVCQGILTTLPAGTDLTYMPLAEPLACAIHMLNRIKPWKNDRILIIGGGVLGVLFALLCRFTGKNRVFVVEKNPCRLELLKGLGLECASPQDARDCQAEIAIPCCPDNEGFTLAVTALKPQGKLGFFSGLTAENPVTREVLNLVHYKELALFGAYGCGVRDSREAVRMLLSGFPVDDLPLRILSLADLPEVLEELNPSHGLLNIVKF